MPRKPAVPKVGSPLAPLLSVDKGLAVKDSLREVRFNVKHGARKLVQAVEAATHRHPDTAGGPRGPLGLLGEPLNLAVRTTASLLSTVDHAAVDLLSFDGPHRSMTAPLRSSVSYFGGSESASDLRAFATDHLWRYRHWLAMKPCGDVFVHEQAIALAGAEAADAEMARTFGSADDEQRRRTAAIVIRALMRQAILSKPGLPSEQDEQDEHELAALGAAGAVVVVLAGEVAGGLRDLVARDQYAGALRLADEITAAERSGWETALRSTTPVEAMARWLAFVLRHV